MAQCTCAFRLSLFNSSYFKGGAAKSRCGKASGKGKAADREDVLAGFLGQRVSREDLPAEHRDQAHCQPGFGADADLQVCSSALSCPTLPVQTPLPHGCR